MFRHTMRVLWVVILASLFLLTVSACGGADASDEAAEVAVPEADTGEGEEVASAEGPIHTVMDPANFSDSTNIDNEWLPMQPGTQWVLDGIAVEDGEEIPHRIEFAVTDLTKEIDGVQTVVAWIVDISDGEIVEKELAFYAQDNDGNVWYFGEHPEEFEEGEFVKAPTWISGFDDAKAGVKMWAAPELGSDSYFQGWGPAVEWTDFGQIDQMGEQTCVAVDCYEDVLVIAESSLDEFGTGAFQLKYYARDVGNVRVGWKGDDAAYEELELLERPNLDEAAMAAMRAEALEMEAHAYEISDIYAQTQPAEMR